MLEDLIWGEPLAATIPAHVVVTVIHNGGGLLAAYAHDGPAETGGMVGLTYWWPGLSVPTTTSDGKIVKANSPGPQASSPAPLRLKMCSHMAGVLPAWQGTGLGLRLKLAQRAAILEQGVSDWVTWTYDPLLRTNGAFNLHRLGAVCNTYHVNLYGELPDELNAGIQSDRCQVDWWLTSGRVEECSQDRPVGATRRTDRRLHPPMLRCSVAPGTIGAFSAAVTAPRGSTARRSPCPSPRTSTPFAPPIMISAVPGASGCVRHCRPPSPPATSFPTASVTPTASGAISSPKPCLAPPLILNRAWLRPLQLPHLEPGGRSLARILCYRSAGIFHPPNSRSTAIPTASATSSRQGLAATCTPIGIPALDAPARTVTTGHPSRLNGSV